MTTIQETIQEKYYKENNDYQSMLNNKMKETGQEYIPMNILLAILNT